MNARTTNGAAALILRLLILCLAPLTIAWPHHVNSTEAAACRMKTITVTPLLRAF